MKQVVIYEFTRLGEEKQAELNRDVQKAMRADPRFQSLLPMLDEQQELYAEWQSLSSEAQFGDTLKIANKNKKRKEAINLLYKIALQVNILANGESEIGKASGFSLRQTRQLVDSVATPHLEEIIRLDKSGCVQLRWNSVRGAIAYTIAYSTDGGKTRQNGTICKSINKKLSGFTPGLMTSFWVKAIGANSESDWSNMEEIMMS